MAPVPIAQIRLVTWDVDGTLYSMRAMKTFIVLRYLKELLNGRVALANRELSVLRRHRHFIETVRAQADGDINGRIDGVNRELLDRATSRWYGEAISKAGPRVGVEQVLNFLRAKGIPQAVFSDYEAESKLKRLGLGEYFDRVYVGETAGILKPNPELLKQIARDFSVDVKDVLHIGDRIDTDYTAAEAAGCQCLIVGKHFRNFDSLLNQFIRSFPGLPVER